MRERIVRLGFWWALWETALTRLLWALQRTPTTPRFDRWYAFIHFVMRARRLPGSKMLLNDVLYRAKVGGELASPTIVRSTDKVLVKGYIEERLGPGYTVPTLAVLSTERAIRSFAFPESCVIKPTHSSGRTIVRRSGEAVDLDLVVSWLDHDLYRLTREPQYRGLERRIVVEPLIDHTGEIGVFCFGGRVRLLQRRKEMPPRLFAPGWVDLHCTLGRRLEGPIPAVPRPRNLAEIERIAAALAEEFSLVRVDVFHGVDGDGILVGELTHCHSGGAQRFWTRSHEEAIGARLFGAGD